MTRPLTPEQKEQKIVNRITHRVSKIERKYGFAVTKKAIQLYVETHVTPTETPQTTSA